MKNRLLVGILLFLISSALYSQEERFIFKGKSFLYAPYFKIKPHIDGKSTDEVWLKSAKFNLNKMDDLGPIPYYKTKVMTYSDKSNLYFSFECSDSKMDKISKSEIEKDNDKILKEDYILVTLTIGEYEKAIEVISIIVSANGVVRDAKNGNASWDCKDFKFAIDKNKTSWNVEMSIPFASILEKKKYNLKDGMLINLYRVRPEKGWDEIEESSWVSASKLPFEAKEKEYKENLNDFGYLFMQNFSAKPAGVSKNIVVNNFYNNLPALDVKVIDKKFIIDGDIEAQIREGIKPIEFKMLNGENKKPLNKTHVWVLTTKLDIIICIRNYDSSVNNIKAVKNLRDKINWGDDINEIFFNIGEGVGNDYYQIAVDAEGTLYDSFDGKADWNGNEIKAAVKKGKSYWDVEIQIPFDNLDLKKVRSNWKKPWRLNVSRVRPEHIEGEKVEETAWSPTGKPKSGIPDKFGYIFMNVVNAKFPPK